MILWTCWPVNLWFSTLDLASGNWQVSLSSEARCKTTVATHSGLFQLKVMPFDLCNAPATFKRLMDRVLQGLRWSRCLVYLDDIISFGTTFEDALDNLTLFFDWFRAYDLQLKSTKCHLFRTSVPFLGHIVGRRGLECDPKKIEDVKAWPLSDCLRSVRQFLGFVGYYRRFVPGFADLAEPQVALTGKDVLLSGDRPARRRSSAYGMRLSGLQFWPSSQRPNPISWIRILVTLGWAVSGVRSRMMWSVSSRSVAARFDPRSGSTVRLKEICWLLSPCVFNFILICVSLSFP